MKKLFSRLFIISLASVALSGCDFFSIAEEELEADGLELKNYKTAVVRNTEYEFTGNAYLKYSDDTGKVTLEKDVTEKCTFPTLDTSGAVGTSAEYKVSYEGTKFIYSKTVYIKIVDSIKLESIELRDFSKNIKASESFTFDGKVIAIFNDSSEKDVTEKATITLDASSRGLKQLVASYSEGGVTKSVTEQVSVYADLESISISGYRSSYEMGDAIAKSETKVLAKYSDNSSEDVTSKATIDYSNIDTSTLGDYTLSASYTENGITKEASVTVSVKEKVPTLTQIKATGYTNTVDKGKTYTFDGTVVAVFDDSSTADVTANCTFSSISTTTAGTKTLTISYKDPNHDVTKTANVIIEVISKVTGISVNTTINLGVGKTASIGASVLPSDAKNKGLLYSSNKTSVATVDENGQLTGISTGTAVITITSEENSSITATTTVNVSENPSHAWTVLLYICGADLESESGLATSDLKEILSVAGQPDDVNIVIQTGGAKSWNSTYGISASYNQRYHVANKKLVSDNSKVYSSYKSMGLSSTLQDFLTWGIQEYPADKMGLILWNHGGGLAGVCYDEKKSDDSLLNNEVVTAVSGAFSATSTSKFEFIGYDACLMQTMEVAEFNSQYFNYQVASQESESGYGWDYDTWVDDLYAKKSSETIFTAIVDGFITDNGGVNGTGGYYQGTYYPADQTLSFLDLRQMEGFKTAWEAMAAQVKSKITSSNKSTFKNIVKNTKYFAGSDYTYFALFDCYNFLDKVTANSTFNPGSSYISDVKTAIGNLIKYNSVQKEGAADAHGLSFYFGSTYNSSTYSHFTNWVSIVSTVGGFTY